MAIVKPHPSQLQSTSDEHNSLYKEIVGMHNEVREVKETVDVSLTEERTKKVAVFYISKIRVPDQSVSLFIPFEGVIKKAYIKLEDGSEEELGITMNKNGEIVFSEVVDPTETYKEMELDEPVNYESLTATVNGEIGLENINICLDIVLNK